MPGKRETGFRNLVFASLTLCCVIIFALAPPAIASDIDADTYSFVDTTSLALKGSELSEEEAQQLEEEVKDNPENLPARIQLLGYYFLKTYDSDEARKARQKHVLWIIEHHPEREIAGAPFAELDPSSDDDAYFEAKKLWLQQVDKHKRNAKVLGNAANFFFIHRKDIAEDLLKQAQSLEPHDSHWAQRLGFLYQLEGRYGGSAEERRGYMRKALEQYEKAASLSFDPPDKFYLLPELAETAFGAGNLEKARGYADELLTMASEDEDSAGYGSAIHAGNIILGRIALSTGDIKEAKAFLLSAVAMLESEPPGYYNLDFTLAKELWRKGEKEAVIEYLELCRKFWEDPVLERWIKMVKADIEPDFES